MAITTLSISDAFTNYSTHDSRATSITAATVSATINGTINGVNFFGLVQIAVPSTGTCTWSLEQYVAVASTWVTVPYDIDNQSYPRSAFTGGQLLTFAPMYGAALRIVQATAPASDYVVGIQARE